MSSVLSLFFLDFDLWFLGFARMMKSVGFWLWVASAILCFVAALLREVKKEDLKVE